MEYEEETQEELTPLEQVLTLMTHATLIENMSVLMAHRVMTNTEVRELLGIEEYFEEE